jgi:hypothetical protein
MDKYGTLLILLIVVVCYFSFFRGSYDENSIKAESKEGMAPLDYGSYDNPYLRGGCAKGSFKRTACSLGNCPLGTTISDKRYCGIMCAQEVEKEDRRKCNDYCMDMVKDCI